MASPSPTGAAGPAPERPPGAAGTAGRPRARLVAAGAALGLAAACGGPAGGPAGTPLLDGLHAPDLLTESRRLDNPPSTGGNRFVQGWRPWRRKGTIWFVPEPEGARVEVVNLRPRGRRLLLNTEIFLQQEGDRVEVEIDGRPQPSVPLAAPLAIDLPADLPAGRVPITLTFPEEAQVALDAAGFDEALPPGEVELEEGAIRSSGFAAIDFVRHVEAGARLRGRFSPPEEARPEQRFSVSVERQGGAPATLFEWRDGWWNRVRGERRLDLPLGAEAGLVRVRLTAEGRGPPAVWHDLRVVETPAAETRSPPATPAAPQVVIVYVLDALRADYLGHLGAGPGASPEIDRLATDGVVFARHQSVAPNTLPSTKSLFSGLAFVQRGHWKLPADGHETLAEAFARADYRTGAFSGNGYVSPTYGTARGFEKLAPEVVFREYPDAPDRYNDNADRVHRRALAWLDGLRPDERVFLYLHTIHPHNPYDPPRQLQERFAAGVDSSIDGSTDTLLDVKHNRREAGPADRERLKRLYAGALAYNDAEIGRFMTAIRERYPAEEVLLIVTSDHGEELFDHGGVLHGYTLYRDQLHIPLLLHWPGTLSPRRVETATDNLDLHESLMALAGAADPVAGGGRSFWDLALGEAPGRREPEIRFAAASSVKGGVFLAQSARYKLIHAPRTGFDWGMGEGLGRSRDPEYLFDLESDPDERINRAGDRLLEVDWLRARLEAWVERGKLAELGGEEPVLDDDTRERLRALGYLE